MRTFLSCFLFGLSTLLQGQVTVDTFAGGKIRSGVPADSVAVSTDCAAYDPAGRVVFCDGARQVLRRVSPDGIVTTIAGTGLAGFSGDGGLATAALLNFPSSAVFDTGGNLFFTDSGNRRIRRVDCKGIITTVAGNGTEFVAGQIQTGPADSVSLQPGPLAVDRAGNVYFLDSYQGQVLRVRGGAVENYAGVPHPDCVRCGWDGNGGPARNARLSEPLLIAADGADNLFIVEALGCTTTPFCDTGPYQIRRISPDGVISAASSETYGIVYALTGDGAGHVYARVSNFPAASRVIRLDATGPFTLSFDKPILAANSQGEFIYQGSFSFSPFLFSFPWGPFDPPLPATGPDLPQPTGLAIDSHNNIYFSARGVIYKVQPDGSGAVFVDTNQRPNAGPALVFDSQDRLYAAGTSVLRILPDSTPKQITGISGDVHFIQAGRTGQIYVITSPPLVYQIHEDATATPVKPGPDLSPLIAANLMGGFTTFGAQCCFAGDGPAQSAGGFASFGIFGPDGATYLPTSERVLRLTGTGPTAPPVISSGGVVNATSFLPGTASPGELIAIFGQNFGTDRLLVPAPQNNAFPQAVSRTKVIFTRPDGFFSAGMIAAVTPTQINAFVPRQVSALINGQTAPPTFVSIQVQVDDVISQPVTVSIHKTDPGLSSTNGSGQASVLNQDGSVNSATNPAARDSVVSFFGTGEGAVTPQVASGTLAVSLPYPTLNESVSMSIGGQPAQILYAGTAPSLASGVFQINARIPASSPAGDVRVMLSIGGTASAQKVTIAVR